MCPKCHRIVQLINGSKRPYFRHIGEKSNLQAESAVHLAGKKWLANFFRPFFKVVLEYVWYTEQRLDLFARNSHWRFYVLFKLLQDNFLWLNCHCQIEPHTTILHWQQRKIRHWQQLLQLRITKPFYSLQPINWQKWYNSNNILIVNLLSYRIGITRIAYP